MAPRDPDDLPAPQTVRSDERRLSITERMRVVILSGADRGKTLSLSSRCTIGKSRVCDLTLADTEVSREHLQLDVLQNGILARDLGSTNGSFFHGARFTEVTIGVGARLTIGMTELQIQHDDGRAVALPSSANHFGGLWGQSVVMRQAFALLERVAPSEASLLIEGETGTGKEICAHAVHAASARKDKPFIVCDLSALPRSLIESELFGHQRGSFTGADRDRAGAFAQAHGGTIFLDEIGELDLELQPRLLRAIEQGQVKPIGSNSYKQVDVRVLSATNRDLSEEVDAGRFRQDLLYRLSALSVRLPPLRERLDDIPLLVEKLLAPTGLVCSPQALAVLSSYDWPGNVRELRNALDRAATLAKGAPTLTAEMVGLDGDSTSAMPSNDDERFVDAKEKLIARWEHQYLVKLLERTKGNVSAAAREGGIARVYLYRLMKKYGIRGAE